MPTNEMAPVAPVAAAIAKSSFESAADTQTAAWAIPSIATVLPDAVGDSSFVGIGALAEVADSVDATRRAYWSRGGIVTLERSAIDAT
jgi:hypothetical protein